MTGFYPYQIEGGQWLAKRAGALLADAPRVGKTGSIIHGADRLGARRVLWLTRGAGRADHGRAWRRFQNIDRSVNVVFSSADFDPKAGVVVASYALAAGALREAILAFKPDVLALDEMHLLKTSGTLRTQAALGPLTTRAGVVWGASGTPAPNHYGELYPFLRAALPVALMDGRARLMSRSHFEGIFCRFEDKGFGRRIVGSRNHALLADMLRPHLLRRRMEDVQEDVPPIRQDVLLLSSKEAVRAVLDAERDAQFEALKLLLGEGATDEQRQEALAKASNNVNRVKLRLVAMAKVEPLVAWVREQDLPKVVLFGWHTEPLRALRDALGDEAVMLDGSTPAAKRDAIAQRFQTDPTCKYFVGQIEAAGEAIDLSAADLVVFLESAWTPGRNDQAMLRIVNTEKTRRTEALFATVEGTVDEHVQRTWARRAVEIGRVFN